MPYSTDLFTTTAHMIAAADLANVSINRGFLSTNATKGRTALLKDGQGTPVPIADTFHGERFAFTNQAAGNLGADKNEQGLVYGDWADFLIGCYQSNANSSPHDARGSLSAAA